MQRKYEISVTHVEGKSLIKSFVPSLRLITFLTSPDFPKMKLGFILKTVDLCTIFINYLENSNVGGCRTNIYLGYKMEHIQAICISLKSVLYLTAIHIFSEVTFS